MIKLLIFCFALVLLLGLFISIGLTAFAGLSTVIASIIKLAFLILVGAGIYFIVNYVASYLAHIPYKYGIYSDNVESVIATLLTVIGVISVIALII